MGAGEAIKKATEFVGHDKNSGPYRLYMMASSAVIMVLASVATWGIGEFVSTETKKIDASTAAVVEVTKTLDNHIKADIIDRGTASDRISVDEGRIGRIEQNRDDITGQIQSTSAARDRQFQSLTDAISKVSDGLAEVRSQVSEIKGKIEYALPDRRGDASQPHPQ